MTEQTNVAISFSLIVGLGVAVIGYVCHQYPPYKPIKAPVEAVERQSSIERLITALIAVESNGDDSAIGDGGLAVGCLQIHPIMVRDVNRILGYAKYSLADRYDRCKSRNMCKTYLNHYLRETNIEFMARCWNGGPTGYKKESTKPYWAKVKARLEE